ncbi:hypothetical protein AM1_5852 [Acaryochloris marina MBIC11017]|uniref:Uncharacterized protein n=2 Tax=Acaryochloris marina TaxID=155978 RepID=B0C0K0_ACAM1|nr:hypothetical protein AM1_5852 [Acaryochloris marina MBIC11017]BDM79547.1 hypothetical protein AM10699_24150 [Acaryochloris marina MBIC10699]
MGKGGFQACVNENQVDLFLRSKISDVEIHRLSSKATSRAGNYQPIPLLTATQQPGTNKITWNWRWAGTRKITWNWRWAGTRNGVTLK